MKMEDTIKILNHTGDFFFVFEGGRGFKTIRSETIREVSISTSAGSDSVWVTIEIKPKGWHFSLPPNENEEIENVFVNYEEAMERFKVIMEDHYGD